MEWGTFFTVVVTLYLVYYGFVFLVDLLTKGRPVRVSGEGIEYNMSNLLEEEEVSQVLGSKAFEEPTVTVYNTQAQAEEEYPEDSEEEYPEDSEEEYPEDSEGEYPEDSEGEYAEEEEYTDEELESEEVVEMTVIEEPEEVVEMAVMGEPMQPNNYLKMIREQAMQNALSTSKTIFS